MIKKGPTLFSYYPKAQAGIHNTVIKVMPHERNKVIEMSEETVGSSVQNLRVGQQMKCLFFFMFNIFMVQVYCQTKPIDSLFYENGTISTINYQDNFFSAEPSKRIFRKSNNEEDSGIPLYDTLYLRRKHAVMPVGNGISIIHFDRNSRMVKSIVPKNISTNKYGGTYSFFLKELPNLRVDIGYDNDTIVKWIIINKVESNKKIYGLSDIYSSIYFEDGGYQASYFTKVDSSMSLTLDFNGKLLNSIKVADISLVGASYTQYNFYSNFHLKSRGLLSFNNLRVGKWKFYHENGNIKAYGGYELIKGSSELVLKTNKSEGWKYFYPSGDNQEINID